MRWIRRSAPGGGSGGHTERRLLASIHDVSPRTLPAVDRLLELLRPRLGGRCPALLVVPDHWGEAPIRGDAHFAGRLRGWAAEGAEIFLHGWYHRDAVRHARGLARLKARHLTAGEGEFLGLDETEALRRMEEGRALVEDIADVAVAGFVAPAWLYGEGAMAALPRAGFALAEDHFRVWRPADGAVLARGPVITWASRSAPRRLSSRAFARFGPVALRHLPTVRLAVHPGDVAHPPLVASISRTVDLLRRSHAPGRYADLLSATPLGPPARIAA